MMHGFGFGGIYGMILIWILLILGSIWLVKELFSGGGSQSAKKDEAGEAPLEILKKRYARGELTRDEYEQIKKDLASRE